MAHLRHRRRPIGLLLAAVLGVAPLPPAGFRDVTTDAVTRATTRNVRVGQESWLTDGRTPDVDAGAGAVSWEGVGMVTVTWPDSVRLARIQVYASEMTRYRVFGYLGGGFSSFGDRLGQENAVYGREDRIESGPGGWIDIAFPEPMTVDNLSFQVIDGGSLYEMRFLAPDRRPLPLAGCGVPLSRRGNAPAAGAPPGS